MKTKSRRRTMLKSRFQRMHRCGPRLAESQVRSNSVWSPHGPVNDGHSPHARLNRPVPTLQDRGRARAHGWGGGGGLVPAQGRAARCSFVGPILTHPPGALIFARGWLVLLLHDTPDGGRGS